MTGEVRFTPDKSYDKTQMEKIVPANTKLTIAGSPSVDVETVRQEVDGVVRAQAAVYPHGEMDGEEMPPVLLGQGGLHSVTLPGIGTFGMVTEK